MKEYIERSSVMDALQGIPSGCIGEPCLVRGLSGRVL